MTRIIRTKLPYFNSVIIIFVLQFEMTKLGQSVTNKYGQVFSQVNFPFYHIFNLFSINKLYFWKISSKLRDII